MNSFALCLKDLSEGIRVGLGAETSEERVTEAIAQGESGEGEMLKEKRRGDWDGRRALCPSRRYYIATFRQL